MPYSRFNSFHSKGQYLVGSDSVLEAQTEDQRERMEWKVFAQHEAKPRFKPQHHREVLCNSQGSLRSIEPGAHPEHLQV